MPEAVECVLWRDGPKYQRVLNVSCGGMAPNARGMILEAARQCSQDKVEMRVRIKEQMMTSYNDLESCRFSDLPLMVQSENLSRLELGCEGVTITIKRRGKGSPGPHCSR